MKNPKRSDISNQRLEFLAQERLDLKEGHVYTLADVGFLVYLIQDLEYKLSVLEETVDHIHESDSD